MFVVEPQQCCKLACINFDESELNEIPQEPVDRSITTVAVKVLAQGDQIKEATPITATVDNQEKTIKQLKVDQKISSLPSNNEGASLALPSAVAEVLPLVKESELSLPKGSADTGSSSLKASELDLKIEQKAVSIPSLTHSDRVKGDERPLDLAVCSQTDASRVVLPTDLKVVESPSIINKSQEIIATQVMKVQEAEVGAVCEKKLESFVDFQRVIINNLDLWKREFDACPKPGNFFKKMLGMVANLFSATNITVKVKAFRSDLEKAKSFEELSAVVEDWFQSMCENIARAQSVLSFEQVCKATEAIDLYEKNLKQIRERMKK
jgi:hypothetical protein